MPPTPSLARHAITQRIPAVMVTGSHIPFDRNGLKFYRPDGEIDKLDEQAILAAGQPMTAIEPTALPPAVPDAIEAHVRRKVDVFPPGFLKGRRIGPDQHSSVSREVLPRAIGRAHGGNTVTDGHVGCRVQVGNKKP